MHDGDSIDSGFTVPPGAYTIHELIREITPDPIIVINDPSHDSFSQGSRTTVGLAARETVTVTYYNPGVLPDPPSMMSDQKNESNRGTSVGGEPEFLCQSFRPTAADLTAVDLLVRPGGFFPIRGTNSLVMVREGSPTGNIIGKATAYVSAPEFLGQQVWVQFRFAAPIALTPENEYFISWYMPGAPIMTWMANMENPYDRGTAYNSSGNPMPDTDYNFVTYCTGQ